MSIEMQFNADTNETRIPARGKVGELVTREMSFATAHHVERLLRAAYESGFDAGLRNAATCISDMLRLR